MATNLFSSSANTQNKPLIEFRAGIMNMEGKKLVPDKRKGLIQILRSPDGLVHFVWKDRTTGIAEHDFILFPEDASFKKLKQGNGRVFLLEFTHTKKQLFFWSQETSAEKDGELAEKTNNYINNPPEMTEEPATTSQNLDRNAVMEMLQQGAQQGNQQELLAQLNAQQQQVPDLSQIINPDTVLPLLSSPQVQERLLPLLPEGHRTPEELAQLIRSPQFQQSLQHFGSALQSGQLGEFMRHLGLDPHGSPSSVEGFLRAIQEQANQNRSQSEKKDEKKDDSMDTSK